MDDRIELYGDDMLAEYVTAIKAQPEEFGVIFEKWREQWQFDRVIITSNPPDETKPNNGKSAREVYF
ncbi:hypothetical protein NL529_34020, partial [Klebsiella pneumoniae]|nr:hypothetical protein [Klebsiella pneumoniae]